MSDISYGSSLPDSEVLVNTHSEALISLLPTLSSFISAISQLEREAARQLSTLAGKARKQANAEQSEGHRGGRDTTLEVGWQRVLESVDVDARKREAYADQLERDVVAPLTTAGTRFEGVRKRHHAFAGKLLAERDRAVADRDKSRQKYYDACETLEQARQKKTSAKDDKAADKAERAYASAEQDMLIAKNQFLLDTDTANASKNRLYTLDLPAVHDSYQLLEQSTISAFTALLNVMTSVQSGHLSELMQGVESKKEAIAGIDVHSDQRAFVNQHSAMKLGGWEIPRDLGWEECPVWHDTPDMSTTPSSTVYLQNIKLRAQTRLAEVQPAIDSKRREIDGLKNLRDAYERDRGLGDAGSVMENLFVSTHETTLLEIQQTELQAQVDLIDNSLGDASNATLAPHDLKSSSFVKPEPCSVCGSSVWGKGLSCRACGLACHAKCELKVPAGCSRKSGTGHVSRSSGSGSSLVGRRMSRNAKHDEEPDVSGGLARTPSQASSAAPPRRAVPPPFSTGSAASAPQSSSASSEPTATLLYDYAAATSFELTVSASDVVRVVEPEDESGWVKVRTMNGMVGLVPGSYLQLGGDAGAAAGFGVGGGGGGGGGGSATALYSYAAAGADELSLSEGERVQLTSVGTDAGEGWAEVTKAGRTGLVPVAYLSIE